MPNVEDILFLIFPKIPRLSKIPKHTKKSRNLEFGRINIDVCCLSQFNEAAI